MRPSPPPLAKWIIELDGFVWAAKAKDGKGARTGPFCRKLKWLHFILAVNPFAAMQVQPRVNRAANEYGKKKLNRRKPCTHDCKNKIYSIESICELRLYDMRWRGGTSPGSMCSVFAVCSRCALLYYCCVLLHYNKTTS